MAYSVEETSGSERAGDVGALRSMVTAWGATFSEKQLVDLRACRNGLHDKIGQRAHVYQPCCSTVLYKYCTFCTVHSCTACTVICNEARGLQFDKVKGVHTFCNVLKCSVILEGKGA